MIASLTLIYAATFALAAGRERHCRELGLPAPDARRTRLTFTAAMILLALSVIPVVLSNGIEGGLALWLLAGSVAPALFIILKRIKPSAVVSLAPLVMGLVGAAVESL